ncbi:MAG: hypothetical protein IKW80_06675 [Thermoguttaceae bacterium]|nr:hypothetical protein [Thermoguttaceae bacterium]
MKRLFLLPILMVLTSVCWADSRSENEPYVPSNSENPPAAAPAQPKAKSSFIPDLKGEELNAYGKQLLKKWARVRDMGEDACRQAAREYIGTILAMAKDDKMDVNSKRILDDQIKTRLRSLKATIGAYNKQRRMARLAAEKEAKKAAGIPIRPQSIKPRQNNNQNNDGILAQQGEFANILGENAKTSNYEKEGEELVELIQKTVCIDTWEINGGNGTIYYYGPMKAMVVNQTAEVHEEISAVLEQLRRAGN